MLLELTVILLAASPIYAAVPRVRRQSFFSPFDLLEEMGEILPIYQNRDSADFSAEMNERNSRRDGFQSRDSSNTYRSPVSPHRAPQGWNVGDYMEDVVRQAFNEFDSFVAPYHQRSNYNQQRANYNQHPYRPDSNYGNQPRRNSYLIPVVERTLISTGNEETKKDEYVTAPPGAEETTSSYQFVPLESVTVPNDETSTEHKSTENGIQYSRSDEEDFIQEAVREDMSHEKVVLNGTADITGLFIDITPSDGSSKDNSEKEGVETKGSEDTLNITANSEIPEHTTTAEEDSTDVATTSDIIQNTTEETDNTEETPSIVANHTIAKDHKTTMESDSNASIDTLYTIATTTTVRSDHTTVKETDSRQTSTAAPSQTTVASLENTDHTTAVDFAQTTTAEVIADETTTSNSDLTTTEELLKTTSESDSDASMDSLATSEPLKSTSTTDEPPIQPTEESTNSTDGTPNEPTSELVTTAESSVTLEAVPVTSDDISIHINSMIALSGDSNNTTVVTGNGTVLPSLRSPPLPKEVSKKLTELGIAIERND